MRFYRKNTSQEQQENLYNLHKWKYMNKLSV